MRKKRLKLIIVLCLFCITFTGCELLPFFNKSETETAVYRVIGQDETVADTDNYYYNALPDAEKRGYDKIKKAVVDLTDYVVFDDPLSAYQIAKLFRLVYTQENGIFWLSELASPNQKNNSLKMTFRYNADDIKYMRAKLSETVRSITESETATTAVRNNDNYALIKYLHDYLILHCVFTETGNNTHSAYGALVNNEAQCEGYAFAFALLAKKLGFDTVTVTGKSAEGLSHAWNKVYIENPDTGGNWYNVDCTWDDPVISFDNPAYLRNYYMCVPDRDIANTTHFEDTEYVTSPAATSNTLNFFTKEGLLFSDSAAGLKSITDQIFANAPFSKTECEIRFDGDRAYTETVTALFENGDLRRIIDRANAEKTANIKTAYHTEDDNLYIIHISLVYN
jgi:hypothetical protein